MLFSQEGIGVANNIISNGNISVEYSINSGLDTWITSNTGNTFKFGVIQPNFEKVIVISGDTLVVYNFVSDNNDQKNDFFEIKNLDKIEPYTLTIFDKQGNVILRTSKYNNDWNARNLEIGVYFYTLQYKNTEVQNTILVSR